MSHASDRLALHEDQVRLHRMLQRTVGEAVNAGVVSVPAEGDLSLLDVACGACDEAETLSSFFRGLLASRNGMPGGTRLVGTDVRERELSEARERFRGGGGHAYEFFRGDAAQLGIHRELGEDFDVVVLRHQNLYHGRTLWQHIFDQSLHKVRDDGMILITSYFDREHALALEAFEALGAEVVTSLRNPESRRLPTPGKSVDRHVAVLRRRKEREIPLDPLATRPFMQALPSLR